MSVLQRKNNVCSLHQRLLAGPSKDEIERIIDEIKSVKLDITREGNIQDFLGIHIMNVKMVER